MSRRSRRKPNKEAVTGSHRGSHLGERLPPAGELIRTQADGDHASSRTDPDNTERLTCIYGSAGCAFQSLPSLKLGNRCSGRGAYPEDRQSRSLIQGAIVLYVPHR